MPDLRTVFLSDDGTGTVLFKFVADKEMDLSSGTLFAAKVSQTPDERDPAKANFKVTWIELGKEKESALEGIIREYDGSFKEAKYINSKQISAWAETKLNLDLNGDGEISKPPFNDDRPAFLESRKAAAALGASAEFRKMEGININFKLANNWWSKGKANGKQAYMYVAMSNFNKTMSDKIGDIQLDGKSGICGAVYRMKLVKNSSGLIDIEELVPAIVGGPISFSKKNYICEADNIAEPDNLVILDDGRVIIGEDSGNHLNNMIWIFDDPATR